MNLPLKIAIVLILFSACDDFKQAKPTLPESKGKAGELVLIAQPSMLQRSLHVQVDSLLKEYQPYLGQPEEYYRVIEMSPGDLTNYTRLSGMQVILETEDSAGRLPAGFWSSVSDTVKLLHRDERITVKIYRDVWARPQHIIHIKGVNVEALTEFLAQKRSYILEQTLDMEYSLIGRRYSGYSNDSISTRIADNLDIKLSIPNHYRIARINDSAKRKGFAWVRNETPHISQGILIYYRPYMDSTDFETDKLVTYRDSITKAYVPGAAPNSYMSTFTEWPLTERSLNFKGLYAKEIYGLWNTQNDFMGGPFYSVSYYDTQHKRLVTLEGFVHAPKYNKTQYLRELIGIIGTLQP